MARTNPREDGNEPDWRQRAISRSLSSARSRAEQRVERFLEAGFALIDEKGTTDFTIQELVERSNQSLRGFYRYFEGRDELLFALFEEIIRESEQDLREAVETEADPIERIRAFTIRLHEWCEPGDMPRKRGEHNRFPISEFTMQLALKHPERVRATLAETLRILVEVLDGALAAGVIEVGDTRRAAVLVQQTVMFSWMVNRLLPQRMRITAEETWEFCLRGLGG